MISISISNGNISLVQGYFPVIWMKKWLKTLITWKWFLSTMGSFMNLQSNSRRKWLETLITWKWFLSSMGSSMCIQLISCRKWLRTLLWHSSQENGCSLVGPYEFSMHIFNMFFVLFSLCLLGFITIIIHTVNTVTFIHAIEYWHHHCC